MNNPRWQWPKANLSGGVDGSAMSKLFRGGKLSDTALLGREAIQNSKDAHDRFAYEHPDVPLRIVFRFAESSGEAKARAVDALDLRGLAQHRDRYLHQPPLQPGTALDALDDPEVPLRLLYVEDYGTHGLFGDPTFGQLSHLYMAMYSIGATTKSDDAGGSYGFGKSALERASRTHSVIAHTTFVQRDDDPVRSRLVGFTWWPNLQDGKTLYEGRAAFADHAAQGGQAGSGTPFVDDEADGIAVELGFESRDPSDPGQLGSSFLIVDPGIDPGELRDEINKWWWPALEDHLFDVQIKLPSGEAISPQPAQDAFVAQFLPSYRIARRVDEPDDPNRERRPSDSWRKTEGGVDGRDLGALGLVVPDSPVDEDGEDAHTDSLVALVRGPRMVIKYLRGTKNRVPIRGTFVASDTANPLLRRTEPSSHDDWSQHASSDLPAEATRTAKSVVSRIRRSVGDMAKEITPTPPKSNYALGHFSKLMNTFLGNKRGPGSPPEQGGEPIELHFPGGAPSPSAQHGNEVNVSARFTVRVADTAERSACQARVACQLLIHEETSRTAPWPVTLTPDTGGFTRNADGSWTGVITKDAKSTFTVVSEAYPNLWTTSLQPTVTRIGEWSDQ